MAQALRVHLHLYRGRKDAFAHLPELNSEIYLKCIYIFQRFAIEGTKHILLFTAPQLLDL